MNIDINNLSYQLGIYTTSYETLRSLLTDAITGMSDNTKRIEDTAKYIEMAKKLSSASRDNVKKFFEDIITEALKYVTESDEYKFCIEEITTRQNMSYEFYIEETINGEVSRQKPEDANGGGFIDIISVSAKFAYLMLYDSPKTYANVIVLDEPGKMISKEMSVRFAEYIKNLCRTYNKQVIMVTHNEAIMCTADNFLTVSKVNNLSKVSKLDELSPIDDINWDEII